MVGKDKELESLLSELHMLVSKSRDEVGLSPTRQEMGQPLSIALP